MLKHIYIHTYILFIRHVLPDKLCTAILAAETYVHLKLIAIETHRKKDVASFLQLCNIGSQLL